jgi:hypothetical protein
MTRTTKEGVGGGEEPIVFIVEDDTSLREALRSLFSHDRPPHRDFRLGRRIAAEQAPGCSSLPFLDVRLPGLTPAEMRMSDSQKRAGNVKEWCETDPPRWRRPRSIRVKSRHGTLEVERPLSFFPDEKRTCFFRPNGCPGSFAS